MLITPNHQHVAASATAQDSAIAPGLPFTRPTMTPRPTVTPGL